MPTIASRITSAGTLYANGGFDEVSYNSTTLTKNLFNSGNFDLNYIWIIGATGTNVTVTPNQPAPDGTSTAALWTRTTTSASYFAGVVNKSTTNITYTFSIYVKASVGNYCALRMQGSYPSRADVVFDISNGVISTPAFVSSSFTNASATITPVDNRWYRISLTATTDTNNLVQPVVSFNSVGGVIDVTDSVSNSAGYVWHSQFELGSQPTYFASNPAVSLPTGITSRQLYQTVTPTTMNMLTYSNAFDNTGYWSNYNVTSTPASINDPVTGLNTGYLLTESTATNTHNLQAVPTFALGDRYTLTVYAKSYSGDRYLFLLFGAGSIPSQQDASFDLVTGTVYNVNTVNGSTASITSVGNGWYRCSLTTPAATSTGISTVWIALRQTAGLGGAVNYTGNGTSGIYIADAQVEVGTSPTPYVAMPLMPSYAWQYLATNSFDEVSYNPTTLTKNKFVNTDVTSAFWTFVNGTVTGNTTVAPDGTTTAATITGSSAAVPYLASSESIVTGTTYTFSIYAKAGTQSRVMMLLYGTNFNSGGTNQSVTFDLSLGTTIATAASPQGYGIQPIGAGWYRIYITGTATTTTTDNAQIVRFQDGIYTSGNYAYVWNPQCEIGAQPTFYVATPTVSLPLGIAKQETSTGITYVADKFDEYSWSTLPVTGGQIYYLDTATPNSYNGDNILNDLSNTAVTSSFSQLNLGGGVYTPNTTTYSGTTVLDLNNTATSANASIVLSGTIANLDALALTYNFTVMFAAKKNYYGLLGNLYGNSELFRGSRNGYNAGWRIIENSQGTPGTAFTGQHSWSLGFNDQFTGVTVNDLRSSTNRMCIVAVTVTAANLSIWCNGSTNSITNPQTYVSGTGSPQISVVNDGAGAFQGQIGFFTIYNRALSTAEITQNYNAVCGRYGLPRL